KGYLGSLGSTAIKLQPQNWKEQTLNVNTTCQVLVPLVAMATGAGAARNVQFPWKKMRASPIRIPTVSNDTYWDFCFHLSQQTKIPEHQQTDELYPTSGSGESEQDAKAKEEKAIDRMSLPKEKLAQSQKKNTLANKELIRCVILPRIIFGEEPWKCAQALATLAYGYVTLREHTADLEGKHALRQGEKGNPGNSGHALLHSGEAYFNLQKSERNMEELKKSYKGGASGLQVSEEDLTVALG
ncbi:hypothetical protein EI555_012279, partial [Monodon monoceros]